MTNQSTEPVGRNIASRLLKKFGTGDVTAATINLYKKIERIVEKHGEEAYEILNVTVTRAEYKNLPAHWFARTVTRQFKELGWWNPQVPW
jgi:hypothetical protein